jgi:hypothetical protein
VPTGIPRLTVRSAKPLMRSLQVAKWLALGATAFLFGRQHIRREAKRLVADLAAPSSDEPTWTAFSIEHLPPPVARYLKLALPADCTQFHGVTLIQRGSLRTTSSSERWMSFKAVHVAKASAPGFVWDAQVKVMPFFHINVTDTLTHGVGAGRVRLMSVLRVAGDTGTHEINSGALHRYLAEAVWYPFALLPRNGLTWSALDEYTALATLADGPAEVALEFRFADSGEVESVFAQGRWGTFDGHYEQKPWEGHFRNYQRVDGVLIPMHGEVGWYTDGKLDIVWRGEVQDVKFMAK